MRLSRSQTPALFSFPDRSACGGLVRGRLAGVGIAKPMGAYENPTRMTDEINTKLIGLIRAGNYSKVAAEEAGIHASTYHRWMARGQGCRRPLP